MATRISTPARSGKATPTPSFFVAAIACALADIAARLEHLLQCPDTDDAWDEADVYVDHTVRSVLRSLVQLQQQVPSFADWDAFAVEWWLLQSPLYCAAQSFSRPGTGYARSLTGIVTDMDGMGALLEAASNRKEGAV